MGLLIAPGKAGCGAADGAGLLVAPNEAGCGAADGAGLLVAVVGAAGIEASWLSGRSGKIARTCDLAEVWRSGQVEVLMATTAAASTRCVVGWLGGASGGRMEPGAAARPEGARRGRPVGLGLFAKKI